MVAAALCCFAATLAAQSSAAISAILAQAQANIREGRDTDARRLIADAEARIKHSPDTEQLPAWTQLGDTYLLLGEPREAQRAFTALAGLARRRGSAVDESRGEEGLGRAALMAHDPATAIAHLQRSVDIAEGLPQGQAPSSAYRWLVSASMMQAQTASDAHVERAFNVAARARHSAQTRFDIAATLKSGEAHVEYLIGEETAYGWVLTREHIVGFAVPTAELETNVDRAVKYLNDGDRDGLVRISEELAPAVLGPILEALPSLTKIMFVPDGALERLPFAALWIGDRYLGEQVAVFIADAGGRQVAAPLDERIAPQHMTARFVALSLAAAALIAVAGVGVLLRRRR